MIPTDLYVYQLVTICKICANKRDIEMKEREREIEREREREREQEREREKREMVSDL